MSAKKIAGGIVFVLLIVGVAILAWKLFIGALLLFGVLRLVMFYAVGFVLDAIVLIVIARVIMKALKE